MSFKNLPWWGQIAIAAVATALIVFSQYKWAPLALQQKQAEITRLRSVLEEREAQIRKGRQAKARLEELERDIAALERKLGDLRQILPTQPELGDLLKWIKSLADQTNLDLRVFGPGAPADQEFLREQPIRMEVAGNYHQLGMFFDRVSKYSRIINVEGVRIGANADPKARATIQAAFTAKTYIYRESAEAANAGGGA